MRPTEVNDPMFPVDKVIYNNDEFSIIWGTWNKESRCLGMRWNNLQSEPGFPRGKGGRPIWLVIPSELSVPFLTALIGKESTDNIATLEVLRELWPSLPS
jgi:hypothetical protein